MKKKTIFFVLLGLGISYFFWLKITHIPIPCIFRKITGLRCPGCGITTMIMRSAKLDFSGAFAANPFLFVTAPLLLGELVYYVVLRSRGKSLPRWNDRLTICYTVALCAFGIMRNIGI